jgi:hypothetical protein
MKKIYHWWRIHQFEMALVLWALSMYQVVFGPELHRQIWLMNACLWVIVLITNRKKDDKNGKSTNRSDSRD